MSIPIIPINPIKNTPNWRFNRYSRGQNYPTKITNTCEIPKNTVTIDPEGECFICRCGEWLPNSVGNINSMQNLDDIWNTPTAKILQQDIADQKFTWCAVGHCGILDQNMLGSKEKRDNVWAPTHYVNLSTDNSCNLACPSCRPSMVNFTTGPIFDTRYQQTLHILELFKKFDKPLKLIMIGGGDPLASLIMRPLILDWDVKPTQYITLFTNGLLMKKLLPDSKILPGISEFWISIDAGSKEVYENVRRPGKFEILIENLEWLAKTKSKNVDVLLKFTLSDGNAADIINFAELCNRYGFYGEIGALDNLDTYADDFNNHEVFFNIGHPLHQTAIHQLQHVKDMPNIRISPSLIGFSTGFNKDTHDSTR